MPKRLLKPQFLLTFVAMICLLLPATRVWADYSAWQPPDEGDLASVVDGLVYDFGYILQKAVESKAAHPAFLEDLHDLLERLQDLQNALVDTENGYTRQTVYQKTNKLIGPDLRFIGIHDDKIGTWGWAEPDGSNDGHFQVLVNFPAETDVYNIRLHKSNAAGEELDRWWYSHESDSWILGVFRNGQMLNPKRKEYIGRFEGWVLLDLYGAVQDSCFDKDAYLLLQMKTSMGELSTLYRVGEPESEFALP